MPTRRRRKLKDDIDLNYFEDKVVLQQEGILLSNSEPVNFISFSQQEFWLAAVSRSKFIILNSLTLSTVYTFIPKGDEYIYEEHTNTGIVLVKWLNDSFLLLTDDNTLIFLRQNGQTRKYKLPVTERILWLDILPPDSMLIVTKEAILKFNYWRLEFSTVFNKTRLKLISKNSDQSRILYVLTENSNELFTIKNQALTRVLELKRLEYNFLSSCRDFVLLGTGDKRAFLYNIASGNLIGEWLFTECTAFLGFLNESMIYQVTADHLIFLYFANDPTKPPIRSQGPQDLILQAIPLSRDSSLVLLSSSNYLYRWRFEPAYLESNLVPNFTLIESCIDVGDNEENNPSAATKNRPSLKDPPHSYKEEGIDINIDRFRLEKSESWFLQNPNLL